MEFIVNEQGCNNLISEMQNNLNKIVGLINEIESQEGTLKAALGDDYDTIARSVRVMTGELNNAYQELNTILGNTTEYMSRIRQVKVSLG